MYIIFKCVENLCKIIRIKVKILYWKLKYGKRIKIGKKLNFRKGLVINISKNGMLEIGDNNFFNNYCSINCQGYIKIENNNLFGENVKIYDHNHIFNNKKVDMRYFYKIGKVYIRNYNWFGSNVTILSKTNLGDRNVIAANSTINEKYDSENLIRTDRKIKVQKILYVGDGND